MDYITDIQTNIRAIQMPPLTLLNLVTWIANGAMIFGGVVPFIPQYREIKRTQNAEGFSTFVCLTLLIANILRILFWFGRHFELPLLLQSIIMTGCMLVMVQLCTAVKNKMELIASKPRSFTDFDAKYFWRWTDFLSYVEFTVLFAIFGTFVTYLFINIPVYVETIGFLAVFAEAMLGMPQFYRNYQNKSTIGMSIKMVGFWTCGDVFKTVYFVVRAAPAQFWICGALQVSIDLSILFQVYYYGRFPQKPAKPAIQ